MAGGDLRDQPAIRAGHRGAHHAQALALLHEHGGGGETALALIAEQTGIEVDGERKTALPFPGLRRPKGQHRRADIREPQRRPRMHRAIGIEDAGLHRHATGHLRGGLSGDLEFDLACDVHGDGLRVWRMSWRSPRLRVKPWRT